MQQTIFIEQQIVDKAIAAFTRQFPMTIEWEKSIENGVDGFLTFQNARLPAEVKGDFRKQDLLKVFQQKVEYGNLIVIADFLPDALKTILKGQNINYLDTAGNAFIFFPPYLAIAVEGKKKAANNAILKDSAFTKTGLRVVFEYLKNDQLLQLPYRNIAAVAKVSLDTISQTNESLKQQGFIRQITNQQIALTDKKRLFEKWSDGYDNRIKPTLFYEKFSFLSVEAERKWKDLTLTAQSCWGGEAAASVQTDFIRPAVFTLYTTESKADLMRHYRFKPDHKGNIHVYFPFVAIDLMQNGVNKNFTHPILTYSDLLNSGDARNIEVAQKINESDVQFFF